MWQWWTRRSIRAAAAMFALDTTPETVCVNVLKVGGRFTANAEPNRQLNRRKV